MTGRNKILYKVIFTILLIISTTLLTTCNAHNKKNEESSKLIDDISEEKNPPETTIIAGGDVMLSRWVGVKIREHNDTRYPFKLVGEYMKGADITFVNLEAPFYDKGGYVTEGMVFKSEPETVEGLIYSGVDIVSLANNHIGDRGRDGVLYTIELLRENGIEPVGAGENTSEAHRPVYIEANETTFAFLAYCGIEPHQYSANDDRPGSAWMDIELMKKDLQSVVENADVVIVSMHMGVEYVSEPTTAQVNFARSAIDGGADVVLGHHPHWVQTTEKYDDGYIIYSLGNLVLDQMWSQKTREGVFAEMTFVGSELKSVEFVPTIIEDYSQPRFANDEEAERILEQMGLTEAVVTF